MVVVDAAPMTDRLIVEPGEPAGGGAAGAGDDRGTGARARAYRDGLAHRSAGDAPGRSRPLQSLLFGWSLDRFFKSVDPFCARTGNAAPKRTPREGEGSDGFTAGRSWDATKGPYCSSDTALRPCAFSTMARAIERRAGGALCGVQLLDLGRCSTQWIRDPAPLLGSPARARGRCGTRSGPLSRRGSLFGWQGR